jgi:hypothetical protein
MPLDQVSDKFQVRTTGPVDPKTRQPVKGRKRHGGIRLGEVCMCATLQWLKQAVPFRSHG